MIEGFIKFYETIAAKIDKFHNFKVPDFSQKHSNLSPIILYVSFTHSNDVSIQII